MPKTGNSGTISFGTQAFVGCFTKIGPWEKSRGKLDASCLSTTGFKTLEPDDLADPGDVQIEILFNPDHDIPEFAAAETITITFPKLHPGATAANLAGTGFLTKTGTPEMVNGSLMKHQCTVSFDGKTGPAFTPETGGSCSS